MNNVPIALMSGLWIAPLFVFWMRFWPPLRPYDAPMLPSPPTALLVAGVALSIAAWWTPAAYYRVRDFERSGRLYERLGVRQFRRLVTDGDYINRHRRKSDPDFRLVRDRRSAQNFIARTIVAERGHIVWLIAGALTALWALRVGLIAWATFITAGNLIVNLWPMLLQRYTRSRIERVLAPRARWANERAISRA